MYESFPPSRSRLVSPRGERGQATRRVRWKAYDLRPDAVRCDRTRLPLHDAGTGARVARQSCLRIFEAMPGAQGLFFFFCLVSVVDIVGIIRRIDQTRGAEESENKEKKQKENRPYQGHLASGFSQRAPQGGM